MLRLKLANELEIVAPEYTGDLKIPTRFIYDAFILQYLGFNKLTSDGRVAAKAYVLKIKEYLLQVFSKLMRYQIKKYLTREDRIVPGGAPKMQEILDSKDPARYGEVFDKLTWRSPSHVDPKTGERIPNERWGQIAKKVQELRGMDDPAAILENLTYAGGLYNLIHNTKTSVLDKFSNGSDLVRALNDCASSKDYKRLLKNASPEMETIVELAETHKVWSPDPGEFKKDMNYLDTSNKPNHKHNPNYYGD